MGFNTNIKEKVLVLSARHCCVCHKGAGINIEVHHILPKQQGGEDTFENAIPLCFDCHADAGHYHAKHPKGIKLSPSELKKHRDNWFKLVEQNKIDSPPENCIELKVSNSQYMFNPKFIRKTYKYFDKSILVDLLETSKFDLNEFKQNSHSESILLTKKIKEINSISDYIDYLNFLASERPNYYEDPELNIQPVIYNLYNGDIRRVHTLTNHSACRMDLSLKNIGFEILDHYKVYFRFENVVKVERVSKQEDFFDTKNYKYNIQSISDIELEFNPNNSFLVKDDFVNIDGICFIPNYEVNEVIVHWNLLAKGHNVKGEILINIKPEFQERLSRKYVSSVPEKSELKKIHLVIE